MNDSWWRQASFYQIYPRSFFDANNDGEGDLEGITQKVAYLQQLNIDAVWLSPFYPSPLADGGYDVSNPRDVDKRFGSLKDFDALLEALHSSHIKVVVDVVPNHVSVAHPWFQKIWCSEASIEEESRFHILNGRGDLPPNNWISVFGGSAWSQLPDGRWYLHIFDSSQPDLNWTNPNVINDGLETLKFWLERGVDGFRVDVAFGLMKDMSYADHHDPQALINAMRLDLVDPSRDPSLPNPREVLLGGPFFDRDEVHDIYRGWRKLLNQYQPERMTVAEAWAYPASRAMDYARPDELHQVFNFDFMVVAYDAASIRSCIDEVLSTVALVNAPATWVLSNHDSQRVVRRLGGGRDGLKRALVLASIAHALPGGVYVYQGEELGLDDADIADKDRQDPIFARTQGREIGRDGSRVPLPWESWATHYGFSQAEKLWLPQPAGWEDKAINAQEVDPHSVLNLYRTMLKQRKILNTSVSEHDFAWLDCDGGVCFSRGRNFVVYANPSPIPLTCINHRDGGEVVLQVGNVRFESATVSLGPNSVAWVALPVM